MHAQTSENEFVSAFTKQLAWIPHSDNMNPLVLLNPLRPIMFKINARKMDRYLSKVLNDRFAVRSKQDILRAGKKNRPIIDIALDAYLEEGDKETRSAKKFDAEFMRIAMDQMKVFMFAGHDTTSSTICYAAHALSQHPDCMKRVRQEYDDVFGKDVSKTAQVIKEDASLLNKLPYTLAVIKEVLRLWPPASSVRMGQKGFFLHYEGKQYPTEGMMVWPAVHAIHRHPEIWKDPHDFNPERFLVTDPADPLFPKKGAWRAFEHGSRNCIGQELALIETKVIMALMLRSFDVRVVYEEFDKKEGKISSKFTMPDEKDRAYQVLVMAAKPSDGMPARVNRR